MTARVAGAGRRPASGDGARRAAHPRARRTADRRLGRTALALSAILVVAALASIAVGARELSLEEVWRALADPDGREASIIVWTQRIPRTLLGIAVGAAFGVAGAVMQALTRNPLADPGLFGVNAGAQFALTLAVAATAGAAVHLRLGAALLGALIATVVVAALGAMGGGRADPSRLVLAGVAVSAVLNGAGQLLRLSNPEAFRVSLGWNLGSLAHADLAELAWAAPIMAAGIVIGVVISPGLNSDALGDELSIALGTRVGRTRALGVVAITCCAGAATALTGGLALIGLMVPHVIRLMAGPDQRIVVAGSALAGPALVLAADAIGRVAMRPGEVPAGIVTALAGAPALILLARRRRAAAP